MNADMTDFEEQSANFLSWFNAQPGTTFHPSLRLVDFRDRQAGRGIIATANIPANTDLFTIPRSIIIKVEDSRLAKRLPKIFDTLSRIADGDNDAADQVDEIPTPWLNLILVLIFEYLHRDSSVWGPYLDILPIKPTDFDTIMFWTPAEVQQLQSSHVISKVGRETADDFFKKRLLPLIAQHTAIFYPDNAASYLTEDELLQMAHCIGSLIMSYAFELQPDIASDDSSEEDSDNVDGWKEDKVHEGTMGMVPMADMLNADAEFNAHLSHGDDVLTMTSIRGIKAGEEVLNYYGPLPNAELCRRYGYTSPKHNTYDVVELEWPLVKMCAVEVLRKEPEPTRSWLYQRINSLEDANDLTDETFVIERETDGPDDTGLCTQVATFQNLPEEYINIMMDIFDGVKGKLESEKEQKIQILLIFLQVLTTRLMHYSTTIAEDHVLAAQSAGRLRMAIDIRQGEKTLIQEAAAWTERKLQGLMHRTPIGQQNSSSPPKKRQKR